MRGDCSFFGEGNLPGGEYGNLSRLKIELHVTSALVNRIEAVKNLPKDEAHVQLRQAEPASRSDFAVVDVLLNPPPLKDTSGRPDARDGKRPTMECVSEFWAGALVGALIGFFAGILPVIANYLWELGARRKSYKAAGKLVGAWVAYNIHGRTIDTTTRRGRYGDFL